MASQRKARYLAICEELSEKPIHQLEDVIETSRESVDVSQVYLPRKHLECLLRFVEERPDTEELILDGTHLKADDVVMLKEYLLRSCVSKLSLRRIKLDATSAAALRQLCMSNPNIVSINLDETCIPPAKVEEIQLIVSLNKLNADSRLSSSAAGVRSEAPRLSRWQACREKQNATTALQTTSVFATSKAVIDEFVSSCEPVFCDASFPYDKYGFAPSTVSAVRWNQICEAGNAERDKLRESRLGFPGSSVYENSVFCAALNALRPYDALTKSLLVRGFPTPGLYVFRLFHNDAIVEIVVDDILPCLVDEDGRCSLVGIQTCTSPFYGALLEKAVAKIVGGYDRIADLSFCDCIELLTGATCFQLNMTTPGVSSSAVFDALRSLSEKGEKLVACPIPRTQREKQALEEVGICCGQPYTVLKADVCQKNGAHYAFLLQISTPLSNRPFKYAFEHDGFISECANGRSVIWLTMEDFAVIFENVFLVMWPFDDASSDHKTVTEFLTVAEWPTDSTLFANNATYLLENKENGLGCVLVTMSASSAAGKLSGAKCLFYKYTELSRDGFSRRYDISERNCLFESKEFWHHEGSLFFNLLPREKLQLTIASHARADFTLRFSTVGSIGVGLLPGSMFSSTSKSSWNTQREGRRLSDFVFCFTNKSDEANAVSIIALAQKATDGPPFPLGVLGWKGDSVGVVELAKPHLTTEQGKQNVTVHSLFTPVAPNESLFLVPYCCGVKCPEGFELTIYSAVPLAKSLFQTADFQ